MLAPIYVLAHYGLYDDNLQNIFSALQLQAMLSQRHYDTSIVLKTRTPTKPIANNLFAYRLNQLDLTNH